MTEIPANVQRRLDRIEVQLKELEGIIYEMGMDPLYGELGERIVEAAIVHLGRVEDTSLTRFVAPEPPCWTDPCAEDVHLKYLNYTFHTKKVADPPLPSFAHDDEALRILAQLPTTKRLCVFDQNGDCILWFRSDPPSNINPHVLRFMKATGRSNPVELTSSTPKERYEALAQQRNRIYRELWGIK